MLADIAATTGGIGDRQQHPPIPVSVGDPLAASQRRERTRTLRKRALPQLIKRGRLEPVLKRSRKDEERLSDPRRATRLALYKQVMALRAQGGSMKGIARELSISNVTVRRFVTGGDYSPSAHPRRGVRRLWIPIATTSRNESSRAVAFLN